MLVGKVTYAGRAFLCPREDLRRVEERYAGSLALDHLQTSRLIALHKAS